VESARLPPRAPSGGSDADDRQIEGLVAEAAGDPERAGDPAVGAVLVVDQHAHRRRDGRRPAAGPRDAPPPRAAAAGGAGGAQSEAGWSARRPRESSSGARPPTAPAPRQSIRVASSMSMIGMSSLIA
jgi:hypothetical protein